MHRVAFPAKCIPGARRAADPPPEKLLKNTPKLLRRSLKGVLKVYGEEKAIKLPHEREAARIRSAQTQIQTLLSLSLSRSLCLVQKSV